jgi:hypothetical protein
MGGDFIADKNGEFEISFTICNGKKEKNVCLQKEPFEQIFKDEIPYFDDMQEGDNLLLDDDDWWLTKGTER